MADRDEQLRETDHAFRDALRARLEANNSGLSLEDLMGRNIMGCNTGDTEASDEGAQD
jgi:hypothetical protein